MTDPISQAVKQDPSSVFGLVLQIIRENGMVVLALVALMYQIYILLNYSTEQQNAWRLTISELVQEMKLTREQRMDAVTQVVKALASIEEMNRTTQKIIADIEEEVCLPSQYPNKSPAKVTQ